MSFSRYLSAFFLVMFMLQASDRTYHALLNKQLFTKIYKNNSWGSKESRSGGGSTLARTAAIRSNLASLFSKWDIKSLLDAPCGDFNWMRAVDLSCLDYYIGLDIVDQIIQENIKKYGGPNRRFFTIDIVNHPLPQVDLILCRDCIQHLTDQDVFAMIANFKHSKSRFLLTSNYPKTSENKDIDQIYHTTRITYRNLLLPPFQFPEPLFVINEGFEEKILALWRIDSLPNL